MTDNDIFRARRHTAPLLPQLDDALMMIAALVIAEETSCRITTGTRAAIPLEVRVWMDSVPVSRTLENPHGLALEMVTTDRARVPDAICR